MKKLVAVITAMDIMLALGAGNTFYVDAVNGNDGYDGLAAEWDGEHGPIRTLANITNLVTATANESTVGDTVYVAEGDYDFGSDETGAYRAIVTNGVRLIGVGDRNRIRIFGSATDETKGPTDSAMRCLNVGPWALVKNMTLCNGRATGNGGCASVNKDSYIVGCVVSNNYAIGSSVSRGGAFSGTKCIRCLFVKNRSVYIAKTLNSGTAWNCVFVGDSNTSETYQSAIYNCTFIDSSSPAETYDYTAGYTILGLCTSDSSNKARYKHSLFSCAIADASLQEGSQAGLGTDALRIRSTDFAPIVGANLGIDYGDTQAYESNFPTSALVSDQKYLDFNGNPRVVGSAIDVGACEADPDERTLTISDAQTALVVTGANKGETILRSGETNTFTLARDYSTVKLLTGVRVNGEFLSFTGENADMTYEYTYGYGDSMPSLTIDAVYAEHNDWYVNANTDPDIGPVGDDANSGYTKYQAKRTLKGAMENALLASGDIVHAAPGVYCEGTMVDSPETAATNRVIVKEGVGLVADEGREVTAIEGYIPEEEKWGSTDPVRCVLMEDGAYVMGFTIRNGMACMGRTTGTVYGGFGGGVNGGTAIDCVISNCVAVRGGGVGNKATLIRCLVQDNRYIPTGTKNPAGGSASAAAVSLYNSTLVLDSKLDKVAMGLSFAVNSTFDTLYHNDSKSMVRVYNCYVESDGGRLVLTNSVVKGGISAESSLGEGSRDNTTLVFDVDGRPDITDPTTAEYAVDKGVSEYHDAFFPAAFAAEKGLDVACGQRVYNGSIDIGPGEYDWRGAFAGKLASRRVSVELADPNVTTNVAAGVDVPAGETLKMKLSLKAGGRVSFQVAAASQEAVQVLVDGEEAVPGADGSVAFKSVAGEHFVEVRCLSGTVTVSSVVLPESGMAVIVK